MSDFDSEEFQEVMLLELTERIEELNAGLLILENDPSNKETYENLMRTLHNLKGLFGLAGYQKLSTLSHSMENLVSNTDSTDISRVTKLIFQYSDELSRFAAGLKGGQTPNLLRFDELTQRLASFDELMVKLGNDLRVRIVFHPDCKVASSRSLVLLARLKDTATINRVIPSIEEIEEGLSFRELIIEMTTQEEEEVVSDICNSIQDVVSVHVSKLLDSISTAPVGYTAEEGQEFLTVRVNIGSLDRIIRLLGDLVVYGQFLREIGEQQAYSRGFRENLANFERTISGIQDQILKMRLVPLETIFNRFPRMVRDISQSEGKKVDFIISGKHVGVDRSVIELLVDPLNHLLRNAITHGIESPDDRIKVKKDPVGVINLSVSHERSDIIIEVKDNGRGLNYQEIRKKAEALGLINPDVDISNDMLNKLLLSEAFSTAEVTTEISGRGVGLTAVSKAMEKMGGAIEIESESGGFTIFRLIIPLSVAIMKVLLLTVGENQFAFPMANIEQILSVPTEKVINNPKTLAKSVVLGDQPIQAIDLRYRLDSNAPLQYSKKDEIVVLWRKGTKTLGFIVDELQGERDIVVKPIKNFLGQIGAFSGATVLEGGRVIFIIDPSNFLEVESYA